MRTMQRLTRAYRYARIEEFDDDSRYVFLSDVHRGDGSAADEFVKNKNTYLAALEHYYADGYTYIEVGDGDELWETPDFKHVLKANGTVYKLLKRFHDDGRLVMIWGNHNLQLSDPEYVRENFSTFVGDSGEVEDFMPGFKPCEALLLRHRGTGQEVLTLHGHQGDFPNDQNWRFTMWTFRIFWKYMHAFGIRSPSSPVKNAFKQHKVERNYKKWIREHSRALICGHTHREKFHRPGDLPYFNTGCCTFPAYITGLEIVGGQIVMIGWRVEADERGYLHVAKHVLAGPEPLSAFDMRSGRRSPNTYAPTGLPLRQEKREKPREAGDRHE